MANYKIYFSGNNIEIYEYEKMPLFDSSAIEKMKEMKTEYRQMQISFKKHIKLIDRVKIFEAHTGIACGDILNKIRVDNFEMLMKFVKLDKYFKNQKELQRLSENLKENGDAAEIDLKRKRRIQTLRENGMHLKRMVREHFSDKSFMMTLTYADKYALGIEQIDKSDRRTKTLWKKLKEDGIDFKYVGVRELQKERQVIHYHYIIDSEKLYEMYEYYSGEIINKHKNDGHKAFEDWFHATYWKYGWVDLRHIEGIDDTGAYLAKYLTKADLKQMEWLEKRRLVLRSTGIKKIEPITEGSKVETIIKQLNYIKSIAHLNNFNQLQRKQVFMNYYESEYVGKVHYFEIHLNRLEDRQIDILNDLAN